MIGGFRPVFPSDLGWVHPAVGEHQSFVRWCVPGFTVAPETVSRLVSLDVISQAVALGPSDEPTGLVQLYDVSARARTGWLSMLDTSPRGAGSGCADQHAWIASELIADLRLERVFALVRADRVALVSAALGSQSDVLKVDVAGSLASYVRVGSSSLDAAVLRVDVRVRA